MLFSRHARLEEHLVVELSSRPQQSVKDLQTRLSRKFPSSLAAIYKAIGKLERSGIVLKNRARYSLNISWVLELSALAENTQQNYLDVPEIQSILPAQGQTRSWSIQQLPHLSVFWGQLISHMAGKSQSQILFDWVPYPWFCLIDADIEERFLRGIDSLSNEVYRIVGGDSYLYKLWGKHWKKLPGQTSFAPGPFHQKRQENILVSDNYVLTVRLDARSTARLDDLYSRIQGPNDILIANITQVLLTPVKAKVTLEHKPQKALRLTKQFRRYFGI